MDEPHTSNAEGQAPDLRINAPIVDASPPPFNPSHRTLSRTGGFEIKETLLGQRFSNPVLEAVSKYQWFLSQWKLEIICLLGIFIAHALLLVRELTKVTAVPGYVVAFVVYDSLQFVLIAVALWSLYVLLREHGILSPGRCGGKRGLSGIFHTMEAANQRAHSIINTNPRQVNPPKLLSSFSLRLVMFMIVFLAANRLAFGTAVVCPAVGTDTVQGRVAASYQPCLSIAVGSYPFPPLGAVLVLGSIYSSALALSEAFLLVSLTSCYVSVLVIELSLNYVIMGTQNPPHADDTVLIIMMMLLGFVVHMKTGLNRMTSWRKERAAIMSTEDHSLQQQVADRRLAAAEAARLRWKARVQMAVEVSYESLSAYAAHELRNPLHVLLGTCKMQRATIRALTDKLRGADAEIKQYLESMISDGEVMDVRLHVVQRIVYDLTDFWQLRAGTLVMCPTKVWVADISKHMDKNARILALGETIPRTKVDPALPLQVLADHRRLQQLCADVLAHAVASGSKGVRPYILLLNMEKVWPMSGSIDSHETSGAAASPLSNEERDRPRILPECRCELDARIPGSTSHLHVNKEWLCIVVVSDTMKDSSGVEVITTDPIGSMVEQMVKTSNWSPYTPIPDSVPLPVKVNSPASNLSLAVAKLLSRHLGGDMMVFEKGERLAASISSAVDSESKQFAAGIAATQSGKRDKYGVQRFYLAMLPLLRARNVSIDLTHPEVATCGIYNDICPHCGLKTASVESMQAATLLFSSGGRIPAGARQKIEDAIISSIATFDMPGSPDSSGPCRSHIGEADRSASSGSGIADERYVSVRNKAAITSTSVVSSPMKSQWSSEKPVQAHTRKKLFILYVDDEASNRLLMARFVSRLGHSCVMLSDGIYVGLELVRHGMLTFQEAEDVGLPCEHAGKLGEPPTMPAEWDSAYSQPRPFDLIILDIVMPLKDGASVCMALRKIPNEQWKRIPIIAATGNAPHESRLLEAGFTSVLPKPFSIAELKRALAGAMHYNT